MKSENKGTGSAVFIVVGIVFCIICIKLGLYFFAFIGFFIAVSGIRAVKKKNNNGTSGDIVSGINSTMPENNTYIRSAESYGYTHNGSKEGIKDKAENPNECPICKEVSANGYCIKCGYRFR